MKNLFFLNKRDPWFWAFLAISVILLFLVPIMSLDAGNSGDEDGFQIPYAEQVYNFYTTGGKDTTCLTNDDMGMHGGFFDPMAVAIVKAFNIDDYATARHLMNSFFGYLGMLFAALLAYRLAGWRAGVFTFILMFLSPRYLGHSFNNPKDLIFAATMMGSLYYGFRLVMEYPKPKISTSILLAIFTALAVVSRFAGYLVFAYIVLFLVIYHFIINKKNCLTKEGWNTVGRYFIYVAATAVVTFLLAIAMWPYIMDAPVKTTMKIVTEMSKYAISLRQLFEGSLIWSDVLPWYYTPKYILMTIPITVIIGFLLFFIFCWKDKQNRFWAFCLLFTFIFPVFYIIITHANVYGGWRHAMFAYPPMVVAAGWGIDALLKWVTGKICGEKADTTANGDDAEIVSTKVTTKQVIVNIAGIVLLLCSLIGPIRHTIVNHPYEYVYFNALAGGIDGAYGKYEMDYYYHSTREASEWIIANAEPNADGSKIKVGTWHYHSVKYFFRNDTARFAPNFIRWYEKGNNDWDYAIFTITGMQPEQITNKEAFPPKNCVHTIYVDDKPICLVLKRENKDDLLGYQYRQQNKIDTSLYFLTKAVTADPYNEAALQNLTEIYMAINQLDSAKKYIDMTLKFMPKNDLTNYYLAQYYTSKNQLDDAEKTYKKIISNNALSTQAYYMLCNIYFRKNDINSAEKTLNKLIELGRIEQNLVGTLIQIYRAKGLSENDAYKKLYKKIAETFEAQGKKEEAKQYREAYNQLKRNIRF